MSSTNTVNDVLTNAVGAALNALVPQLTDYLNENCQGKITEDDIYNFLGTKSLGKASGGGTQKKIDTENGCQYVFTDKSKNRPNEICGSTRFKGSYFCSGCRKKKSCETQAEALAEELGMSYDEVFGPAVEVATRGTAAGRKTAAPAGPSRGTGGRGTGASMGRGAGGTGGRGSVTREGPPRRDAPPRGVVDQVARGRGAPSRGREPEPAPASRGSRREPEPEPENLEENDDEDLSLVRIKDLKGYMLEEKSCLIIINQEEDGDPDHMTVVGALQDGKIRGLKESDVAKAKKYIDENVNIDRKYYENNKELREYSSKKEQADEHHTENNDDEAAEEADAASEHSGEEQNEEEKKEAPVHQVRGRGRAVV